MLNALSGRQMSGRASLLDDRQRHRKARGDSRDTQGSLPLHKIITHNVSNDPGAIRSVYDRFGRLSKFLVGSRYSCHESSYRIDPVNHMWNLAIGQTSPPFWSVCFFSLTGSAKSEAYLGKSSLRILIWSFWRRFATLIW